MDHIANVTGIEINPKFVGALFTERVEETLRVFCFYINGGTSQFEVPAEANRDNLHHFFSKLNMDATCSSVVIDEVVQGRIHARSGAKHWLFTLLSAPGNVLPPFDADIFSLSWHLRWQSQETDILEFGKPGDFVHCLAIRTLISENSAARLLKESRAFTNPVSVRKKSFSRRFVLSGIAGALFLGITAVLAGSLIATQMQKTPTPVSTPVARPANTAVKQPAAEKYYLLNSRQITGPYTPAGIADMKACGLLSPETLCRPENATEWTRLDTVFPLLTSR